MNHERSTTESAVTGCVGGGWVICTGVVHMNLTAIAAAVSAALSFGLAWQPQAHNILKINLEHSDAIIQQQRGARAAIERATTQVIAAQNAAATRNARIAADAGRAADAGNGLRATSTTAVRASTAC